MKFVRENFFLYYLLLVIGILFIEVIFFTFTLSYSTKFVNIVFNEATDVSKNKISLLTEILNNSTLKLFSKFRSDLILVGKHLLLLKDINHDLQYYKNYKENEMKNIISSKLEDIISNAILNKYYDNTVQRINYIKYYDSLYNNINDPNVLIDSLFNPNNHKELNLIGYYKLDDNHFSINSLDETTNVIGKYLISVLKSLFIGRYFIKRNFIEYFSFVLFHENECFIYPVQPYNSTISYEYTKNDLSSKDFPHSFFANLNSHLESNYFYYIIKGDTHLISCLSISYYNKINFATKENVAYICLEIDIENLFRGFIIEKKTKLEVFSIVNEDLSMVYFDGRNLNSTKLVDIFNGNFSSYQYKEKSKKQFFHLLYYDLFESNAKNVTIENIINEYHSIYNLIINKINKFVNSYTPNINQENETIDFYINKTACYKNIYNNKYKCSKELFLVIIDPFIISNVFLDKNYFVYKTNLDSYQIIFYSIAVLATNEGYSKNKVSNIIYMKLLKVTLYYILFGISIASLFSLFLMLIFRSCFKGLDNIIRNLEKFLFYKHKSTSSITFSKFNFSFNKEMKELSKIINSLNINYILKRTTEDQSLIIEISNNLNESLNYIKNKDIKNRYLMIIAHYYYEKGFYEKGENQFASLINYINEKENSYLLSNEYDESKIKDTISRKSSSAYLNEFSSFKGISDNIMSIIKIKLLKQKINYLHGMSIFKIILHINKNRNYIFKNRKKNDIYLQEAIKNFKECREINSALGINPIIEIFSLIMMSKCFMITSKYKNAISNLTDALTLFERLTEIFKDESGEKFNPKIMFFVLNYIFQSIMLSISQVCFFFNKNCACNWISIKILETSPFMVNNVFFENCFFSQNSMRVILKRKALPNNANTSRILSYYSKVFSRIYIKFKNDISWKNKLNFYNFANPLTTTMKRTSIKIDLRNMDNLKSIFAKDSKFLLKKSKLITICISEKVIVNLNGTELKDVLVKYLQKFFIPNDNDLFSFIQFTFNGKKSIYLKPERLDFFLKRFQTNKDALRLTEYLTNNEVLLSELYNLFDFMIKQQREEYSYKINNSTFMGTYQNSGSQGNSNNINSSEAHNSSDHKKSSIIYSTSSNSSYNMDKIIILFIKCDDLRFNNQDECIHIVNDLNKNNCTVIIFCYDEDIKMDKIFNIYCFLEGLFDGYFFQVKNYQQIKQTLMSFSNQNYQENFSNINFENLELVL